eukprot:3440092-Prymnesium_polylepis.1
MREQLTSNRRHQDAPSTRRHPAAVAAMALADRHRLLRSQLANLRTGVNSHGEGERKCENDHAVRSTRVSVGEHMRTSQHRLSEGVNRRGERKVAC